MNNLEHTNHIFELTKNYKLRFHEIFSQPLSDFSLGLSHFERLVNEEDRSDSMVDELVRDLRRYRFYLSASPLPLGYSKEQVDYLKIKGLLRKCELCFPYLGKAIQKLHETLLTVMDSSDKPILNFLGGRIQQGIKTGLVVKVSQDVDLYNKILDESLSGSMTVVSPLALKNGALFEQLFIIGPPHWYPNHLYHSPRAPQIDSVIYEWQQWSFNKMPHFAGGVSHLSTLYSGCTFLKPEKKTVMPIGKITIDLPKIDYAGIEETVSQKLNKPDLQQQVPATLVAVSGGKGIFYENHTIRNIWVLALEQEEKVTRLSVNQLEIDYYLLIRTGTGRDTIHTVADQEIGERSIFLRERHGQWKKGLQDHVYRCGYNQIIHQLKRNGSTRANPINLRNWMSEDGIKPQYRNDFTAIIKLLKYEEHEKDFWEEAEILAKYHIRAGNIIRQQLLDVVSHADLSKLELEQTIIFPLPGSSASFTAFKVEYISKKLFYVEEHQTRNLFRLDEVPGNE